MTRNTLTKYILVVLIAGGTALYGVSYYIDDREQEMVNKIIIEALEQEQTLSNIAEITDRNGADEVVESIIRDCSTQSRMRFDELLSRLDELSQTELDEVDQLFESCARFYSARKALMVARMEREYEYYRNLVNLLTIVDDEITVSEFKVEGWGQLVTLEKRRSEIFEERVVLQRQIISDLRAGKRISSEPMQQTMITAQNLNEEVLVLDNNPDKPRKRSLNICSI